jgi:hypothetical protein
MEQSHRFAHSPSVKTFGRYELDNGAAARPKPQFIHVKSTALAFW